MIRSRIRRSRTLSVRPRPYCSKLSAIRISAGCLRFLILSQTLERLTRAMLFREVWNYKFTPKSNLMDVHMGRLRRKIDQAVRAQLGWPLAEALHEQTAARLRRSTDPRCNCRGY
jgi:DNA-binding response OmpR family regulator